MTCRAVADFLMDYVSGELPAAAHTAFERHLLACPNCAEYLAQYRQIITAGHRAFDARDEQVVGRIPEELVRAILAARDR